MNFSINLRKDDLEKIYESVYHEKMLERAKEKLLDFAGCKHSLGPLDNPVVDEFYKKYKINLCDATDKRRKGYILHKVVLAFAKLYDPDIPENRIWEMALTEVLSTDK